MLLALPPSLFLYNNSVTVLPGLCNFSYWWSTGAIPDWFTFTPNTNKIFVFLNGFESFLTGKHLSHVVQK